MCSTAMHCERYMKKLLELSSQMLHLADQADAEAADCVQFRILLGNVRDSAYKIRTMVDKEMMMLENLKAGK